MNIYSPRGYAIACDRCGRTFSHGGRRLFRTNRAAVEAARTQGWKSLKSETKDICPQCRAK